MAGLKTNGPPREAAGRGMAVVAVAIAVALAAAWMGWRFRPRWQPATASAARRLRRSLHPAARP